MNPITIASLLGTLIPQLLTAYKALATTDSNIPPVETLLATADANWQAIITAAEAQEKTA